MEIDELADIEGAEQLRPRPYQVQLEEIATKNNTIIYLPTGSGKTYIAVCLIKRFRAALQKPWGQGGKRTFFLVNTVPLVNQQKKVIECLCAVDGVGAYSGEDGVDYWNKAKWDAELVLNQVIVMTSQILCDMLTHQYIKIEDINLLIFDECHHAVEDHPMRIIMKHFEACPKQKQPRVLGLTATLLNANVKSGKVEETLHELEVTFHATIATVDELGQVLDYSTNPNELVQYYREESASDVSENVSMLLTELIDLVMNVKLPSVTGERNVVLLHGQQDISNDPKKVIKAVKNMIISMMTFLKELGMYGGAIGILAYTILLERLKRKSATKEEELFYKAVITHCVEARALLLRAMEDAKGYDKIVKYSSEKVLLLLNILKEYNPKTYKAPGVLLKVNHARKPLSAIIFTKQRFTAKVLYNLLKDVKELNPKEFDFLKHDFIVGFNINPMKNTREEYYVKKSSQQALLKFRNNDLNCLISTSVIEEGIDMQQCLLVLRYDPPLEYRSYIQSKGRARSAESSYVILVSKNDGKKFMKNYNDFQLTETLIQNILLGNTDQRNEPTEADIHNELYKDEDIPAFITPNGGKLTSVSAISLLNRYCSLLPHDQFTVIIPMWIQEILPNDKRLITIVMPISCPIKEAIKGKPMYSQKSAKRSAALNVCIELYKAGELDAETMLPKRYTSVNFDDSGVKECFPNWVDDDHYTKDDDEADSVPYPGTKKRMRVHKIQFPSILNSVPDEDVFYLHVIKLNPTFEEPKDSRENALYKLINQPEGFGFLTQKPLPKLCKFPIFLNVGEVETSLDINYAVIKLSSELFDLVKEFHYFIFDQVLGIVKKFQVFEGKQNCIFAVPIVDDNGYDIDWETMKTHKNIQPVAPPPYQERINLKVSNEAYKNAVVTPWYRVPQPDRYVVSNVLEYMTPQSQFDSDSYGTFADYYSDKYNLEIIGDKNQALLEVRNISSRMNCLLPRAATIKTFTDKQKKLVSATQGDENTNRGFLEVFVAEFCIKYDFPGVLWYKATMLPSIIHRVFMLLVSQELIAEITKYTKFGSPTRSKGDDWLPIEVNYHIACNSLLAQVDEPNPVNSVDRINNPMDEEKRPPILSIQETLYQLQKKKLNKEYPWDAKMEPIDIERNLSTVTVMDLECYDEFVTAPLIPEKLGGVKSPVRVFPSTTAAISAAPAKFVETLKILTNKPTLRGPELRDVLAALTTIKSNDDFNLERVETLGDSFLKFVGSLYLYHKFPKLNEGQLTNIKGRLISNRNLYYAGKRFNLGGRMKVEQFGPKKDFSLPGFFAPKEVEELIADKQMRPTFLIGFQFTTSEALSGELSDESKETISERIRICDIEVQPEGRAQNVMQCYVHSQAVADKSVADCVEALIGTYLLSDGILGAIKLLEWMRVLPPQDKFATYLHKSVPTVITDGKATANDINFLLSHSTQDIEKIINYQFKDPSFLLEALSHPSYIRNRLTRSYERLEFLGDAILDFLITTHIFENCDLKPGDMTDLRSALVNNVTFASYVVKLGLHKFLCSDLNPTLDKAVIMFVEHQKQRDHEIIEDVLYLIDEEECHIAEYVEVPKVLSDIFEAMVGAIYLDSGGDLQKVWSVVYRVMHEEIHSFSSRIPQQPVKVLYEKIHACPLFGKASFLDPDLPKMKVPVTVTKHGARHTVFGVGNNKSQAKRAAAKMALKLLSV